MAFSLLPEVYICFQSGFKSHVLRNEIPKAQQDSMRYSVQIRHGPYFNNAELRKFPSRTATETSTARSAGKLSLGLVSDQSVARAETCNRPRRTPQLAMCLTTLIRSSFTEFGDQIPKICPLIDSTVLCQNHYIHGSSKPDVNWELFDISPFLIQAFECGCGASEMVVVGWNERFWPDP